MSITEDGYIKLNLLDTSKLDQAQSTPTEIFNTQVVKSNVTTAVNLNYLNNLNN